jgi:hypothetical protein
MILTSSIGLRPTQTLFIASTGIRIPLAAQHCVVLTDIFGFQDGKAFSNGVYDFSNAVIWDIVEDAAYLKVRILLS